MFHCFDGQGVTGWSRRRVGPPVCVLSLCVLLESVLGLLGVCDRAVGCFTRRWQYTIVGYS